MSEGEKNANMTAALKKVYPVGPDFELIKEIGRGSYGTVVRAKHKLSGKTVAIKKLSNVFNNQGDSKRLLREAFLLTKMGRHPNIVTLYDVIEPSHSPKLFNELYYVFPALNSDL